MAKNNKADMSCARVKKYTASDVSKAERHNERKNETYENMNVIEERIPYNVHFKKHTQTDSPPDLPDGKTGFPLPYG